MFTKMPSSPDIPLSPLVTKVTTALLDDLRSSRPGARLPSENAVAAGHGVSRTTVRAAFECLRGVGLVATDDRVRRLARRVSATDYPPSSEEAIPKDQAARRHLLDALADGSIRPGDTIGERAVARALGCSTAPVREAFLVLSAMGLFRKDDSRQWKAAALDERQARELTELRQLLEGHGLRKLLDAPPAARPLARLRELRTITSALADAPEPRSERIIDTDIALHRLILEASGNRLIVERNRFIYALIEFQLRNPRFTVERGRLGLRQHLRIIDAILAADPTAAGDALRHHLDSALETLLMLRSEEGS